MNSVKSRNVETMQYFVLYGILILLSVIPLLMIRELNVGILPEWIARMEELKDKSFQLFSSSDVYSKTGINDNGLYSNLLFWGSGLLYRITGNILLTFRLTEIAIQTGTALLAKLFCESLWGKEEKRTVFICVLLFVLCPYRFYLCYDRCDLFLQMAWMFIPLFAWAVLGLIRVQKGIYYFFVASFSLAFIGYANVQVFLILIGVTCVYMAWKRSWLLFAVYIAGSVICLPGLLPLVHYLFRGGYENWQFSLNSIMPSGYSLGSLLSSLLYLEDCPGIGLGMMFCIGVAVWRWFVERRREPRESVFFWGMGVILIIMSSAMFPWEILQRVGMPFLRLIGLWRTPVSFFGMAYSLWCISAGRTVGRSRENEQTQAGEYIIIQQTVVLLGIGVWIWQSIILGGLY